MLHTQLASLAAGLTSELAPVYASDLHIPREKVLLSREGGRCPRDGVLLEFDPFSPHRHRCPVCGETYTGELHDRFWLYWYQLWLAERALHGALFAALGCDEPSGAFTASEAGRLSAAILNGYADQYLLYPNRDNVLGPTRVFFSTYLESIWLLNLSIALDLLERHDAKYLELGARVRDRIVEPSSALIASYDEGASNRQVWNDAALIAANRLLGRSPEVERAIFGRSGVVYHLQNGMLADGTWYEGENYHLFAHRGLWYAVTMAEQAGIVLPRDRLDRFEEGFATPFLTALPDMTLPSRRDSQYAISLRQPRFAELCELGLARQVGDGDPRLRGVLHRLYGSDVPRGDTGRARSAADVERNLPGTALSRADLGWRSLLFARPALPPLEGGSLGTVLLEAQGIAVFRRERERIYVALDYGTSGGGHGHPDRLNVLLSDGPTRWLDDMGTGSYVDPSLHWYRSTLAHNAPLFDGKDQQRVDGELLAFDEQSDAGWVSARAIDLAPGVAATRTLVVTPDYVLDELVWEAADGVVMDLPMHVDPTAVTIRRSASGEHEQLEELDANLADTLPATSVAKGRRLPARTSARIVARDGERSLQGFVVASSGAVLYRMSGPGAPGKGAHEFLVLRFTTSGQTSWVRTLWDWAGGVEMIWLDPKGSVTTIERRDGSHDRLRHRWIERRGALHPPRHQWDGYRIERIVGGAKRAIDLGGMRPEPTLMHSGRPVAATALPLSLASGQQREFTLAKNEYRRSEESWEDAGQPSAHVAILCGPEKLVIDVRVQKSGALTFVTDGAINPYDNEAPDINGDGLQLYLVDGAGASAWVLVPETPSSREDSVRARVIDGWTSPRDMRATWRRTDDGYAIQVRVPCQTTAGSEFALGIVVNEKPPGRERRRGQLVLGGRPGGFVYLRGDREDLSELVRFTIS
jgi:heparinase II/III-like protein